LTAALLRLRVEDAVRALVVVVIDRREQVGGLRPVIGVRRLLAADRFFARYRSASHGASLLPITVYTVGNPTYISRRRWCADQYTARAATSG
jgi:hypothetical protein